MMSRGDRHRRSDVACSESPGMVGMGQEDSITRRTDAELLL